MLQAFWFLSGMFLAPPRLPSRLLLIFRGSVQVACSETPRQDPARLRSAGRCLHSRPPSRLACVSISPDSESLAAATASTPCVNPEVLGEQMNLHACPPRIVIVLDILFHPDEFINCPRFFSMWVPNDVSQTISEHH